MMATSTQEYDTQLSPAEETEFQKWKAKYAPQDSGADYDLRGAFKAGVTPDPKSGHWPDTFKKPNHPTFSDESQYAKDAPDKAGHWDGETFVPPGKDKQQLSSAAQRFEAIKTTGQDPGTTPTVVHSKRKLTPRERFEQTLPLGVSDITGRQVAEGAIPFVGAGLEALRYDKLKDDAQAVREGKASPDQQQRVEDFLLNAKRGTTLPHDVAMVLVNMLGFAGETMATSGVADAITGPIHAGEKAAASALEHGIEAAAEQSARGAAMGAVRGTGRALANTAVMSALMPTRVLATATQKALPEMGIDADEAGHVALVFGQSAHDLIDVLPAGALDTWIENLSEASGGALEKLPPVAALHSLQLSLMKKWLGDKPGRSVEGFLRTVTTGTRWNGPVAEWLEERVGDVLKVGTGLQPFDQLIPTGRQAATEFLAFSVPGIAAAATRATAALVAPANAKGALGAPQEASKGGASDNVPRGTPSERIPVKEAPDGAQAALGALLKQNREAGAITDEQAAGARLVEPTTDEEKWAQDYFERHGKGYALVDAGGPLKFSGVTHGDVVLQDANASSVARSRAVALHEAVHASQNPKELVQDIQVALPEIHEQAKADYQHDVEASGGTVDPAVLDEEGTARIAEEAGGYLWQALSDRKRILALASNDHGALRNIVSSVINGVNRLLHTNLPTPAKRAYAAFMADAAKIAGTSDTPTGRLLRNLEPQKLAQIALRFAEHFDAGETAPPKKTPYTAPEKPTVFEGPGAATAASIEETARRLAAQNEQALGADQRPDQRHELSVGASVEVGGIPGRAVEITGSGAQRSVRVRFENTAPGTERRPDEGVFALGDIDVTAPAKERGRLETVRQARAEIEHTTQAKARFTPDRTRAAMQAIAAREAEQTAKALNKQVQTALSDEDRGQQPAAPKQLPTWVPQPLPWDKPGLTPKQRARELKRPENVALRQRMKEAGLEVRVAPPLRKVPAPAPAVEVSHRGRPEKASQPAPPPAPELAIRKASLVPTRAGVVTQTASDGTPEAEIARMLEGGARFDSIVQARKALEDAHHKLSDKEVDEAVERGVVLSARQIVSNAARAGSSPGATYQALVDLYRRQPRLMVRTSDSKERQAYSTPIPIAYVASRLARVDETTRVYEPTAGNGVLLIEAKPQNVVVNELDPERAKFLRQFGFESVTEKDATQFTPSTVVDVVLANPPFGKVMEGGKAKVFEAGDMASTEIDHVIVAKALMALPTEPRGRAVLLIASQGYLGAKTPESRDGMREKGYRAPNQREFFRWLYNRYRIQDHFTIDGDLYERQGAGWPIDVIVINGRVDGIADQKRGLPAVDLPRIIDSYEALQAVVEAGPVQPAGSGPGTGVGVGATGAVARKKGLRARVGSEGGGPVPAAPAVGGSAPGAAVPATQRAGVELEHGRDVVGGNDRAGGGVAARTESAAGGDQVAGQGAAEAQRADRGVHARAPAEPAGAGHDDLSAIFDAELGAKTQGFRAPPAEPFKKFDKVLIGSDRTPGTVLGESDQPGYYRVLEQGRQQPVLLHGGMLRHNAKQAAKRNPQKLTAPPTVAPNSAIEGAADALEGLFAVERERPKDFDNEKYHTALTSFRTMAREAGATADDPRSVIRAIVDYFVNVRKWSTDRVAALKTYVTEFARDLREGVLSLEEERVREPEQPAAPPPARVAAQEAKNQFQSPYEPASKGTSVGTLIPTQMATAVHEALDKLEQRVGPLDDFVASELGYDVGTVRGTDKKEGIFSAEQIDALAMAIDNVKNEAGFIIGDQTGVGKGRFVAGMLRWAKKNGQIPVFVTKSPELYSDMFRDLYAIGETDLRVLVTNKNLTGTQAIPLPEHPKTGKEGILASPTGLRYGAHMQHMIETGTLPKGYDAVFTTYSQVQTVKGERTQRMAALQAIAPNSMLVLDESHEAGGQENPQVGKDGKAIPTRADFIRGLVGLSKGTVYSSATYAKNPHVMSLYWKTDMRHAATSPDELSSAVESGGVPLQQSIANMLVQAGQYVRRERNFDGVSLTQNHVEVEPARAESVASTIGQLADFDLRMEEARAAFIDIQAATGFGAVGNQAVGATGASSTGFFALMHNVTSQALLGLKLDAVVSEAKAAHARGEKPVVGLMNTMGSFLNDFMAHDELEFGDVLSGFNFNRVFQRYLDATRRISIKVGSGARAQSIPYTMTDKDMAEMGFSELVREQAVLRAQLEQMKDPLPGSPIDFLRFKMEQAGMRVGEITGRGAVVEYQGQDGDIAKLGKRDPSAAAKKRTINAFQAGKLDALIINSAGSTGVSLHATKNADGGNPKPRHMLLVQPHPDINVFMQMLGRIHRTGQVHLPRYTLVAANLPMERRPAAMLTKKLSSLNANTTAGAKGAIGVDDGVDFLNKYGDEIAADFLRENRTIARKLGLRAPAQDAGAQDLEGLAARLTGRMPSLPTAMQWDIVRQIEASYRAQIQTLDQLGINDLEAKVLPLDARTLSSRAITPEAGTFSPFAAAANLEVVDAKRLTPSYTFNEAQARVDQAAGGQTMRQPLLESAEATLAQINKDLSEAQEAGGSAGSELAAATRALEQVDAEDKKALAGAKRRQNQAQKAARLATENVDRLKAEANDARTHASTLANLMHDLRPGDSVVVLAKLTEKDTEAYNAVIQGWYLRKGATRLDAPGSYEIALVNTESRTPLRLPLSKVISGRYSLQRVDEGQARGAFDTAAKEGREKRQIVTGNVLKGYLKVGQQGNVVFFTDNQGRTREGILFRRSQRVEDLLAGQPRRLSIDDAIKVLTPDEAGGELVVGEDPPGLLIVRKPGQVWTLVARTKAYQLNKAVRKIVGDFEGRGAKLQATVTDPKVLKKVLTIYQNELGTTLHTANPAAKDFAATVLGDAKFAVEPTDSDVDEVGKLAHKAFMQGEKTRVGSQPSRIANTSAEPELRAFQRGVRAIRAETEELDPVTIKEQHRIAREALDNDYEGTKNTILSKIEAGHALTAAETVAADIIKSDSVDSALLGNDSAAYRTAVKIGWLYQNARRDTARALGVIRDALKLRTTGRQMLADLVAIPSRDIRRKIMEREKELGDPRTTAARRRQVNLEIDKLLDAEGDRVQKARRKLVEAGFDPRLITSDYFKDPIQFGRMWRIIAAAKASKWDWFLEYRLAAMLGGPLTQIANITGNAANLVLKGGVQRLAEAMVNTVVKDPNSAQWGELRAYYGSWLKGMSSAGHYLALAFRSELPVFELDLRAKGIHHGNLTSKWDELRGPSLPGAFGRIMRAPSLTSLQAFDEAFKALAAVTEGNALAYREAKKEGKTGDALHARMQEILSDYSHPVHVRSLIHAKDVAFQGEDSKAVKAVMQLRSWGDHLVGDFPLGSILLPFVRTPYNIFSAGLSIPFHPVVAMAHLAQGKYRGNTQLAVTDAARSLIGMALTAAIVSMVGGDDKDKLPLITGSGTLDPEARDLQNRTVPPYSFRLPFSDRWISYRRVEPASVSIATTVDLVTEMLHFAQAGDAGSALASTSRVLSSVADQASDKTFLRTLGDIYKVIVDRHAGAGAAPRLVMGTFVTPMIPNVVRQPLSRMDPDVRAQPVRKYEDQGVWTAAAAALPYYAWPAANNAPPPRYALFGQEITHADSQDWLPLRMLSPLPTAQTADRIAAPDLVILKYNARVRHGELADADPFYGKPPDYWYTRGGETHYFTNEEYAKLCRESGTRAAALLQSAGLNTESPDEHDIKKIQMALAQARASVRQELLAERER